MKLPFLKRKVPVPPGMAEPGATESVEDELSRPTMILERAVRKSSKKGAREPSSVFVGRRARFDDGVAQIGVELENGRRLYYMIHGEKSVERLNENMTDRVPLISAFSDDYRVFTQSPMSDAKAKGFAARESDALERMSVINESKRGRVYAVPHSSLESGVTRIPLLAIMDELAEGKKGNFIAGVMLGNNDFVVLYAFSEGLMDRRRMQVAINPENLDAIAHSFASITGLPDDVEIVIFDQGEFLQKLGSRSWTPYPSSQGFYGIPARHIPKLMLGAAGAAMLVTSGYTAYWYLQERHFVESAAEHEKKKNEVIQSISEEILARRHSFMLKTSVDVSHATNLASALRTDGALVEAVMNRDSYTFTVITPFFSPESAGDGVQFGNAISLDPVQGCTKRNIQTTGGMREIKVEYVCANSGAGFARFGW